MAKTLLKKYAEDENQGYSKEWLDQQLKKEDEERKTELEIWTNDIDQLEKTGELPTENELIELFKTNNDGQEINKEGDVGHDRPANPEGNVEDGEKLQADKPAVQDEAKKPIELSKEELDKFDFKDEDISKAKKKCITLPKGGFKI